MESISNVKSELLGLFFRLTSRRFLVPLVVLYLIYSRPELSLDQILGLLVASGIFVTSETIVDTERAKREKLEHIAPPAE